MLELGHILAMSHKEGVCDVVGACLVLLFESGLDESQLGEATVDVSEHQDRNEGQPDGLVSESATCCCLQTMCQEVVCLPQTWKGPTFS